MIILKELYEFVFSTGRVDGKFSIYKSFPRVRLLPGNEVLEECGILMIEHHDDDPDLREVFVGNASTATQTKEVYNSGLHNVHVLCMKLPYIED